MTRTQSIGSSILLGFIHYNKRRKIITIIPHINITHINTSNYILQLGSIINKMLFYFIFHLYRYIIFNKIIFNLTRVLKILQLPIYIMYCMKMRIKCFDINLDKIYDIKPLFLPIIKGGKAFTLRKVSKLFTTFSRCLFLLAELTPN